MLLRKVVYPYEDIDSWEKFNETPLPDKKAFYSELNLENITDKDYAHAQLKIMLSIMTCMLNVILYCLLMCFKTLETSA